MNDHKQQKKTVLLVGGAGFIGHNLALKYHALGYNVVVADSLMVNNFLYILDTKSKIIEPQLYEEILVERISLLRKAKIQIRVADFRDYHLASGIINEFDPDIVIMLAAVSHASRSNKDPHTTFDHSFRTLENVLDACKSRPDTRLIYMSSSTVYGHFSKDVVEEDNECNPIGIYASLKLAGELLIKAYGHISDLNYSIIRPSALYGERCISRRVSQIFIENAIANRPLIFNADPNEKLDFTYIEDLVDGIILASLKDGAYRQTFNITRGDAQPIESLIDVLRTEFPKIEVKTQKRDELVPKRGTLSNEKASNLLGFSPNYPVELGYRKYIGWYKEFVDTRGIRLSHIPQENE